MKSLKLSVSNSKYFSVEQSLLHRKFCEIIFIQNSSIKLNTNIFHRIERKLVYFIGYNQYYVHNIQQEQINLQQQNPEKRVLYRENGRIV